MISLVMRPMASPKFYQVFAGLLRMSAAAGMVKMAEPPVRSTMRTQESMIPSMSAQLKRPLTTSPRWLKSQ